MRILVISIALLLLGACGPDSELVASGKAHSCQIRAAQARLQANPQDVAAQNELRERAALLRTVIDTADPGDRAALEAAIQTAVSEGCP
jgi:hypothetical protein